MSGAQAGQRRPRGRVAAPASSRAALFRFVQFEFPWALGPPDGRYVLRGHAGEDPSTSSCSTTLGAPQRRPARRAAPRRPSPSPRPRPSPPRARRSSRGAVRRASARPARWLQRRRGEAEIDDRDRRAQPGRCTCIASPPPTRSCARSPAPRRWSRASATATARRSPTGAGREALDAARAARAAHAGAPRRCARRSASRRCWAAATRRWPPRSSRCARALDLEAGRRREAALQLRIALEAALAELEPWRDAGLGERLAELRDAARRRRAPPPSRAAGRPRRGEADRGGRARPRRLEAALRARVARMD